MSDLIKRVKRVSAYPRGRRGDPTWATCFHEAGHAIAAWYTGTCFGDMQVWSAKERAAANEGDDAQRLRGAVHNVTRFEAWDLYKHFKGRNEHLPEEDRGRCAAHLDLDARIDLMVLIGGPAAEAIFRRMSLDEVLLHQAFSDRGSDLPSDFLKIKAGLAMVTGDDNPSVFEHPLGRLIKGEVHTLMKTVWCAVEAVARALHERRRLDYDEVTEVIEAATGERERDGWWLHELITSNALTAPLPAYIASN